MKFSINRDSLVGPLQTISGAVERRQTLPVLANLLFKVEEGILTVTATDLEIEMSVNIQLDGAYLPGDTTVPARKMIDICKSLPADTPIDLEHKEDRMVISSARNRFTLSAIPAQEFPNLEEINFALQISVNSLILKDLFDKTQFAMAHQDVRYYLNGMLLEFNKQELVSVATDGHRLALAKIQLDQSIDEAVLAIIPRKGIIEATKILSANDDMCQLQLSTNHIRITLGNFTFTSKLIDGRFPDYDKVLPKNALKLMVADREQIKEAFTRAAILCNEKYKGVRLNLSNNKLVIYAHNPDQEEAEIELDVDYTDEAMEIGFNVSYLVDALNAIKADGVRFNLGDTNSSLLIESSSETGSYSLYVVMPMRL